MAQDVKTPDVLTVRNAWKSYGRGKRKTYVLKNFNMTVKQGNIYALLGASGCGKTTLLTCVVDQQELDFGTILAFGFKPGTKECGIPGSRLGYMPQEIGLHWECSIQEMITYFAIINGMTSEDVEIRMSFLMKIMQLPAKERIIHTLSGGQQRRLSFSIALLHDPEILILDEPTVGLDPILRQTIWSYLRELTSAHRTTVILTTHYIEEARQANMIGIIRSGRLLAEDSPDTLLTRYHSQNLENVFLHLCVSDEEINNTENTPAVNNIGQDVSTSVQSEWRPKYPASPFAGSWATIYKDFILMKRNIFVTLSTLALPAVMVMLMCVFVGGDPKNLTFSVVNEEWPTDPICRSDENMCNFQNLSCTFLRNLDQNMINLIPYNDEASAVEAIRRGYSWGLISFPANYSASVKERLFNVTSADNETISKSVVTMRMDMSNSQITMMVQHMLAKNLDAVLGNDACDQYKSLASIPVKLGKAIYGNNKPSFREFIGPGILQCIMFGTAMAVISGKIVYEQLSGCPQRASVAGLGAKGRFLGRLVFYTFISLIHVISATSAIYLYIDVSAPRSWPWFSCIVLMQSICGFCIGYFLSSLTTSMGVVMVILFAITLPNFYTSGSLWPLEGISQNWLRWACMGGFSTLATSSARSIVSRGWTLTHSGVWPGFLVTALWIGIATLAAITYPKLSKLQVSPKLCREKIRNKK